MFGIKRTEEYIEKHLSGGKNPMFGKGYKISGDKNGMFGKKHSKKSKDKMSKKRKGERNPRSKTIKVIFDDGRVEEYKTMKKVIEIFNISRPTLINYLKYKKHYKKHKCVFYIDEGRGD